MYLVVIAVRISVLVGVIEGYVKKGDVPVWLDSHSRFQIRVFKKAIL